jgi:hypothetical protein
MIASKETNAIKDARLNFDEDRCFENRKKQDRRRESYKGDTFISAVGWIDRRERLRRKDDPYYFRGTRLIPFCALITTCFVQDGHGMPRP